MFELNHERLTISVEPTEVRLAVAEEEQILRWASAPLPDGATHNGQVARPTPFGEVVKGLVRELDAPRRKAVVSLNGRGALVRIIDMPSVPPDLLEEAVRREARRELPLPLEELYLSWQVIDDQGPRLQVFLVGTPREAIDNCVAGLRSAGVRPTAMDLKPLALVRAVNRPNVVLVSLEREAGSIVMVRGFVPRIVRSVASPGGEARSLEERVDNLIVEAQRTIDFYSSTTTERSSGSPRICLVGALAGEVEVRSRFEARWSLIEPVPPIPLPEELPRLTYLANVGLALKELP